MKWSQIKRVISLTLCVLMVLSLLPTSTLAEEAAVPTETSTPTETATSTEAPTPAAETTAAGEEATPTPAPSDSTEATPEPTATPTEVIPEGPATFVVNFVIDGETKWDLQQTIAEGETAKSPSIPAVPEGEAYVGQVFLYWYAHANDPYDFSTPVTDNLTLYAKFGSTEEAPETKEEPAVLDEGILFSAFSMEGGILPESTPLWTYSFVVDGVTVSTKIVANGDTLDEPEVPSAPEGQKFTGWYTSGDTLFNSFGTQTVTVDGATTLTAKFETAYYVFFYNQFGSVFMTVTPDASNIVTMPNSAALQVAADEVLVGWTLTPGDTTDVGASVTVDGASINLYPIIQKVIWITFDSTGGTYLTPMYILPNTPLTEAAVSSYITQQTGSSTINKVGYSFTSWSGFTFGNTPTGNVSLTANWTANTNTPYKLVYWIENADDNGYSFEKTVDKTGTSGAVITLSVADTATTNLNASYAAYFSTGTYTAGTTIKGDGSSIVNVYHARKTYTLTFRNGYTTLYNQTYKYDQNIRAVWDVPAILNLSNQGYVWQSNLTGDYYSLLLKMPGSDLILSATLWSGSTYTWYYYLETLDGTAATAPAGSTTTTSNGITYYLYKTTTIKGTNIHLTYAEDYFPITGFYQRDGSVPSFVRSGTVYYASLFYRRASYNLTFINGDTTNSAGSIRFETPIENLNYVPIRPSGVDPLFTFNGWFTTEDAFAGTEFAWPGKIMPAKNLVLYANWIPPQFTGIAHSVSFGTSGGTVVDLGSIEYGGTINASALAAAQAAAEANKPFPTDTFGGWQIMRNGSLILFNSSMQIFENVVLYPVWLSTLNFSVTYNLGEATGTAPVDSVTYGSGSQAQVKAYAVASVTPPADKVFIGWRSSVDNKIYYPNSAITMMENTTLTAVWSYPSINVTITYNGNGGATSGGATTFTGGAVNNTYHTVQGNSFLYAGKNFTGWNTASDGSGSWYYPGESVLLGVSVPTAPGALYAIWEDQTFSVSVTADPDAGVSAKSGAGTYVYGADPVVTWTLAAGYEITSVTDNGTTVPAASYTGNSYALTDIALDHDIVIHTQMTLFSLTYDGNGGTAGGNASYSSTKTMNTSFAVDANTFTREGYYFLGWSTSAGATTPEVAYAPGSSVVMPSSDLTLYAVWAAKTALILTANSSTQNYDGTEKTVSGITPSVAGITVENTTAGASGTNPGVYATSFTNQAGLVLRSGGVDVTEQYTVTWADGALTVNPQVTYRASADGSLIGTEWVAYGTGDATYNVTPPQSISVSGTNFYWLGTYNPATANDLTDNTTIYASYTQNKTLVITADSASYVYNGSLRSVTTGTVNVPGVTVTGYTVSGSGTNVGSYTTSVVLGTVKVMSGATDVTYQYDVSTVDGLLTIDPGTTTADSDGYTGTYDNLPHGITVTPAISGSVIRYSLTNSTDPAAYTLTTSPTATDATAGTTVYFVVTNPNYNPVFGSEQIIISKRIVALTTSDATKMYDGDPLTNPAWDYDSTGNDGFVAGQGFATATANGTITSVGTTDNTFGYTLTATTDADNYTFNVTEGTLTVTPSNLLTVDATDVTHMYDGTPYGVSAAANVPTGTTIRYSLTNSTDPASYTLENSPTATHVDDTRTVYFVAVNSNYAPAFGDAQVAITPRAITLTAATQTRVYNGNALTNATVTITGDGFLAGEGYETLPTATGTITDVGSVTNPVAAGTLNAATDPDDYAINPIAGSLSVTARELIVQADNQQIAYPADRPANATLTYTLESGSIAGETPAFNGVLGYDAALASDPLVPDTYTDAIVGGTLGLLNNGTFKASNYSLTVRSGDLEVVDGTFTVDLTGGSWTYDGNPHGTSITGTEPTDTVEYFVPDGSGGWTSTGSTPPTVTNVSDGPLTVKVVVTRPGYDPAEDTTTIAITPANTTADSDGYTGTYDNLPHGITVTPAISGSTIRYSLTNSTDPAAYTLIPSPTATDYTPGTTVYFVVTNPNYNPVFGSEVVTINKRVVALTTSDATKMYDGNPLTSPAWDYDSTGNDGFAAGQGFATATANGTITSVGTADNTFGYTLTPTTDADNYTFNVTEGELTVTPSNLLTVDATDVTHMYDGTPYGVSAAANVPTGTTIRYSLTNSTDPASYTLETSPTATHVDDNKTVYFVATNSNYAPAFGDAQVAITPRAITLTAATQTRVYNGNALTNATVTITGDGFLAGEGYETLPTATGTITDVGSVTNPVAAGTLNAATDPDDYAINPIAGSLSVTARELIVQADNQQIAYPADRPANATLTYTLESGSIAGETPAFNGVLGYDAALASDPLVPDTYTDAIVGGTLGLLNNGTFKASNYSLTVRSGDLEVVDGTFTVDLTGGSWTYDGNPHGTSITGTEPTDTVEYFVPDGSGGWTSTGSTPPTVTNVSDGPLTVKVVVTRPGYDPAEDTTTIAITPANTTADSDGYTGTYDNLPHGITVTPAISGSTIRYSLTNSTDPAAYTLIPSPTATDYTPGTTVYFVVTNPNYNPVFGSEVVTINKRVVALTTSDATKMYDGNPLTNPAWDFDSTGNDGFVAGQDFATATANGSITSVGTTDNTFGYTLLALTDADNYTFNVTEGTLTVTPSNLLTVDATDVTHMYDGTPYGVSAAANVPTGTTIRYSLTNSTDPAAYTLETSPTATHVDDTRTVYFVATNSNYAPAFGNAQIAITPRAITLTAATQTRVYNGNALSDATVAITGDGFLAGEGYETMPTATGTITDVGSVTNPVLAGTLNSGTDPDDYAINPVAGSLSVTARELIVQADNQQIAYPADRPANATLTYTLESGSIAGETPAFNGVLGYDAALASDPLVPDTYTDAIVGGTLGLLNSGDFKASNYTLTVRSGDLEVIDGTFTVDLTGGSWTYDGNPHGTSITGTEPTDTVEYFVPDGSGGWTSTGSTPPTVTNVSDGPLTVKVVVTRPGYDPAEDTTTIAITPANTTADSDGYTGTYDNLPHGITVTPAISGSVIRYSLTNSTDPAAYTLTTSPTATDATAGTTVYFVVTNPNYNPVFGSEQIIISKRIVALTTSDATKMYDGDPLTNPAWDYDSTGNDGFVAGQGFATATANGTITSVGTTDNTFGYTLTATTDADNYTFNVTEGTLTVTPSNLLTVDATDVTHMYDGTPYGVSAAANVPTGTTIRYSLTNSTDPASYTLENSPTATHVDDTRTVYFVAVNSNYAPAFGDAQVAITPRAITLTAATQTRVYNGNALTNATVTITGDGFLAGEGYETLPTATGTITDVGSVTNPVAAGTLNAATDPDDYAINPIAGSLSVTARELIVQADNQQIAYPADRPANATLTYTLESGSIAGETPAFNGVLGYDAALASDPLVPDTYTDAIVGGTLALTNSGDFKASNYTLTVRSGDLEVVDGTFTVDLTGGSWTYDGNPHGTSITGTEPTDTVEYFVPNGSGGWTSTGSTPPTVTDVDDGPLTVKVVVTRPGYDPAEDTTTIAITPANTSADSDGYTGTYDNLPHGITVTPAISGSVVRYSLTNSTDPAAYTLTPGPTATDATVGTTVYFVVTNPNYNPVFGSEVITINKRIVALTTSDATKMYDGNPLTNPAWDYDSTGNDGFVAGQGFATATANGTITNVGTTDNTFGYTLTATTDAANYTFNVTEGTLTVTPSNLLTVDATDVSHMYDGTPYGVSAAANVPSGTTIRYSLTNSTDPASYTLENSPTATHVDDSKTVYFVATNPNYAPAFGNAQVAITPRAITLTAATQTRVYNGNALSDATVAITGDGFLAGEGYETMPTATGTITDVGSVTNPVLAGTLNSGTDPDDYAINPVAGSLSVTARELIVQADNQQIAYPADRPANATLTYTLESGSIAGETPAFNGVLGYDAALASDPLVPDTYTDAIVGGTLGLLNSGDFKASNYTLTVRSGDLEVIDGTFTVDLTGGSWTYDGNPHGTSITGTEPTDTVEYFVPDGSGGWTSTGSTPPTVTNVSDGPLTVKVVVTRPGYDPAEDTTTIAITPANTTADSDGYTGTYDNLPHGITVTPAISGSVIRYSLTNSTDPAAYTLTTSPTATDATAGTTVYFVVTNPNYNPVFGSEQIIISKRIVALTTSDATKMYDGDPLTNPAWDYDSTGNDGFVAGQGFATATANGTITSVGTTDNTFGYTLTATTDADNYTFNVTEGTLTVTPSNLLTVDATDVTHMYDGTPYGVSAAANVPTGTTIRYSLTNSTDPASYTLENSPTATHVDDTRTVYFVAVNSNYAPAFGDAQVAITPRAITLTAATQTRVYNGNALTNATVTITGDGFLAGEGYETLPTATGTITDVGSVTNPVAAGTLNAATDPDDYAINPIAGSLSVTARELIVQADNQQIAYPADRPANATLTYTLESGSIAGETPAFNGVLGYDAALASDPLVPDTYTDAIVGGTLGLLNNGTFKASNYSLTVRSGDLEVVDGTFTVDLTGGSWTYDGNPHGTSITGTEPTDTVEYFVPDGSGGWTSTGSTPPTVTNVSDGPLTVKVVVTRPGYDPAEDTTTIAITPANTTADSDGYTGTYDNLPHGITVTPAISGSTIRYSLTNSTDPAAYTLIPSPTATDYTPGTTVYFVVTNPNYNPVFGSEVVTINKRVVALTTSDATKMYDGNPLTSPAWDYDSTGNDGFAAGQGFATATANGTITSVGTADNTFGYTLTPTTDADNYTFNVTEGELTVTPSNLLTVDATDVTHMYDGTPYGVSAAANVPTGTTIRYSLTNSTDPASYTLETSPTATHVDDNKTVYFVATNSNYAPAFGDAQVAITPRAITLTAATQTRVYNGNALTNATVTITGDGFLAGEGYETLPTATGTITDVGSVTNPVAAGTLNAATDPDDYAINPIAGSLSVTARELIVQADNQQIAYPADRPANATLTYTLESGSIAGETPAFNGVLGYDAALASDPLVPDTYTDAIVGGTLGLLNNGTFKASNYSLTVRSGDLEVVDGTFTVDLTGGSWTYDGNPHGTSITGTEPTDTVEYFVPDGSGGWTSTGSTPPTVTNVSDGPLTVKVVVTRPGYDPAEDTTTIAITPANTTADSDGYTGTYDNLPHGITVTPAISGSTIRYSLTNSTDPAAYTLIPSPTATDYTPGTTVYFVVTNPNYNPVFGSEVVTINKRVVALTTSDATKMYDGNPLTNPAWDFDSTGNDGFVAGQDFATATANGSITSVGTTDNTFGYTLLALTDADNYTFNVTEGELTVTPSNLLTVDATDVTHMYDGTPYGVSAAANVPTGTTIRYSLTNSTDPASYTLETSPTATHVDDNKTVYFVATNSNYAPAFGDAQVAITPRAITLTAATQTRVYNGNALTNATVTITGDGFLAGEGYETLPTATGTITDVGSVTNPVAAGTLNAATDPDDYAINPIAGSLSVTARELIVQADNQQIAYPADRPANATLTYTLESGSIAGETPAFNGVLGYDAALASDPLVPDTYTDAIVGGTLGLLNNGTFKASNYSLTVRSGDLEVVDGTFTVDLTGGSWTYDGNPHGTSITGTEPTDTVEYFVPDGSGGWTSTGSTPPTVTNVSDGPLTVKVVVTRPGYDPAEDTTTIAITPANTTADSDGYTGTYDNLPHGITVTPAISGSTIRYSLTNSTDPAAYTLIPSPTATDYTPGTTVYFVVTNPNYNPVFGSEVVTINKRVVALTTSDATKMYDGNPLTNPAWDFDSTGNDGFVAGQDFATATANGSITSVGTTDNTFGYTLLALTDADNYTFNVTEGELTVTPSNLLTVDATDVTHMYDGTPYGVSAAANVPTGTTIRYSLTNSTDPASYTLETSPTATHVDDTRTVYFVATNPNYAPAFGNAQVAITPRDVVVNTASASRVYDSTALTASGWSIDPASDGFVSGDSFATAATTGSITNVGTANNGFAYTLGTARSTDYSISITQGTLTVTPRAVMIAAVDTDKNFGSADPVFGYTLPTGNIGGTMYYPILAGDLAGITIVVNRAGSDSVVGTYADVLVPDVTASAAVLANYTFATQNAALTINPQVVYNLNTTDAVTGFPQTQWFDLGTNATVATADGVRRPGFRLTGWEDATTHTSIALGGTIPAISQNHTLDAVWEVALYDVIYDANTLSKVVSMPANMTGKAYSTALAVADNIPYLSGYDFLYWTTTGIDGTEMTFTPGTAFNMPDNDLTLKAVWEPRSSPVYYHANGASGGTVEDGRFFTDSIVNVAGNMFARPGYRFLGWSERSATAGVSSQPGNTFNMPPRQVNFYAQWEKLAYTVTYIVTGGTGNLDGSTPYAVYTELGYGDAMPVPTNPALNGYTFDGWTTAIPATVPDGDLVIYGTVSITGTDKDPEVVPEETTPLAGGPVWALLNLILTIATALASILMLLGLIGKKKEEQDGMLVRETKKHPFTRVLTLVPGIGAIIAFILTENMRNPMVFTDRWTLLMIIITLVQLVLVVFGAKTDKDPDSEKMDSAPKAE